MPMSWTSLIVGEKDRVTRQIHKTIIEYDKFWQENKTECYAKVYDEMLMLTVGLSEVLNRIIRQSFSEHSTF